MGSLSHQIVYAIGCDRSFKYNEMFTLEIYININFIVVLSLHQLYIVHMKDHTTDIFYSVEVSQTFLGLSRQPSWCFTEIRRTLGCRSVS